MFNHTKQCYIFRYTLWYPIFRKTTIKSLLAQFSLNQLIDTPTHFTEHPSSLIDLFMTNNVNYVTYCGVGRPYKISHAIIVLLLFFFNIPNISQKTSKRKIWLIPCITYLRGTLLTSWHHKPCWLTTFKSTLLLLILKRCLLV